MRHALLATILATVPACKLAYPADVPSGGDADAATTDSPPGAIDAAFDGAPGQPDAKLTGTVTVTVTDWGGVLPGNAVPVVFTNPDGSVVATVAASAMGKAQADVLPGASVTVVYAHSSVQSDVVTVVGVKPGDNIVITPNTDHTAIGSFTVTHPTYSGSFVKVYGPCGLAPNNSNVIFLYKDCGANPMTVYLTASHTTGLDNYLEKKNVTFVDGGTTDVPLPWAGLVGRAISYTNIPPEVDDVTSHWYPTDYLSIGPDGATVGEVVPSAGKANLSANEPSTSTAFVAVTLGVTVDQQSGTRDYRTIVQRTVGNLASYTLDVGAHLLPEVDTPGLTVSTGAISTAGSAGDADVYTVAAHFQRVVAATVTKDVRWRVFAAAPGNLTLPHLTGALADQNPTTGDNVLSVGASLYDIDSVFGYDDARLHPYDLVRAPSVRFGATTSMVRWSDSP